MKYAVYDLTDEIIKYLNVPSIYMKQLYLRIFIFIHIQRNAKRPFTMLIRIFWRHWALYNRLNTKMFFSYFVFGPIEYCETVYYKNMCRDCVLTRRNPATQQSRITMVQNCPKGLQILILQDFNIDLLSDSKESF